MEGWNSSICLLFGNFRSGDAVQIRNHKHYHVFKVFPIFYVAKLKKCDKAALIWLKL